MIRINLLPYREEKRKEKRQQFYFMSVAVAVLSALIVLLGYTYLDNAISAQESVNKVFKDSIAILDKDISEIKRLQEQTQALLARKKIIESLQRDRADAVRLLSEMTKQMPEGVYIRSLKQVDAMIALSGYAQSSARVSELMRNIEASPWLERPELLQVKAGVVNKRAINEFEMKVFLKRAVAEVGVKK